MADASAAPGRWARLRSWGAQALLVVAVVWGVRAYQTRDTPTGSAPELRATTLEGEPVSLAQMRRQGPVLVHFWATWCGVCQAMEDNLQSAANHGQVLAVATRSGNRAQVLAVLEQRGVERARITFVNDPNGALAARWGVSAFPTSFFVDRQGQIATTEVGYVTALGLWTRQWWAR
ncbi:MAG: redoxin family protein [Deltaproteobacteria bacterium]|nr:redoxin family protein [Deltaproteobacteria bacterium]